MITEEYLDELYRQKKDEQEMSEKGITHYIDIRERVKELLKNISLLRYGAKVEYLEITINGEKTGTWAWKSSTELVLIKTFKKLDPPNQKYFETLLNKYFVIEEITENVIRLKLK